MTCDLLLTMGRRLLRFVLRNRYSDSRVYSVNYISNPIVYSTTWLEKHELLLP